HIAAALKVNATVTQLDLSINEIGAVSAQHIAEAIKVNATLADLNMLQNELTVKGARALVAVAELKLNQIKFLCGMDAMEVDLSDYGLGPADVVLLGFDLRVNATVTELDLGTKRGRRTAHCGGP
ncbi:hypothetical protein T492DRAFT_890000, partial [Pavlovales sp. CCMP2436]